MENLKLSDQELEKIDAEVMNAISGGSVQEVGDKIKDGADAAWKAWKKLPKGVRYAAYAAMALTTTEIVDWAAFSGKGTQAVVHGAGKGMSAMGSGLSGVGDWLSKREIARTADSGDKKGDKED